MSDLKTRFALEAKLARNEAQFAAGKARIDEVFRARMARTDAVFATRKCRLEELAADRMRRVDEELAADRKRRLEEHVAEVNGLLDTEINRLKAKPPKRARKPTLAAAIRQARAAGANVAGATMTAAGVSLTFAATKGNGTSCEDDGPTEDLRDLV